MPVTLKLSFPAGRYHATPWGQHVNEGALEWPPSPWRLLRALVATWRRKCADLSTSSVRRVLEQLVAPPCFHLPRASTAHTRHYMPWEKKGPADRTLVFDTFVAIHREDSVIIHWPEAQFSEEDAQVFRRLTENLTTLGRAEAWVQAESIERASLTWNCVPSEAAGQGQQLVDVFCPDPSTIFTDEHYPQPPDAKKLKKGLKPSELLFDCPRWHLCLDTEIIQAERWPRVPGTCWVRYARRADAFTAATQSVIQESSRRHPRIVARFLLDGPVLPLAKDTVRIAEVFRAALMHRFQGWCRRRSPSEVERFRLTGRPDRYASPVFSGKDATGHYLPGHGHAHFLPTAEGDDGLRVTHVTIYARQGFGDGEMSALAGLRRLTVGDLELTTQLVGLGRPSDFRAELFGCESGAARVWVSATPYVGPAHVGRLGRERYLRKAIRTEWRRWRPEELAGVEIESIDAISEDDPMWDRRPRPFAFRRGRARAGDDGYTRPFDLFRLAFSAPVSGPLCLGYACHFGLGQFQPDRVTIARVTSLEG